jgi:transcriptional regulator with XRE-family HTH domain
MPTLLESLAMGQEFDRERMRQLRDAKGWSQTEAGAVAGFTGASQWSDIETGRKKNPTLDTISRIAEALGVDARTLIKPRVRGKR